MAEAYPVELRKRVVEAYEASEGPYVALTARFRRGEAMVKRWVWQLPQHHVRQRQQGPLRLLLGSQLLRRSNHGDVLVLDNLRAHKAPRVVPLCGVYGVQVPGTVLPTVLAGLQTRMGPSEAARALACPAGPRRAAARRAPRRAKHCVRPRHCRQ